MHAFICAMRSDILWKNLIAREREEYLYADGRCKDKREA